MFDVALLGTLLFRSFPKYISKRSLGRWIPSVSYNLRRGGHVLIDRGDAPGAVATIHELGRRVQAGGVSAVIFPEGTRSRAGELREFRRAGTLALLEAAPDVPVVPITIDQSWRLLAHNMLPIPWGVRVRVRIGEPIARRPGDATALVARVRGEPDLRDAEAGLRARGAPDVLALRADLLVAADVEAAFATVGRRWGALNALVCAAGPTSAGTLEELSDADWLHAFDEGVLRAVRCVRAALPLLRKARFARIVTLGATSTRHQNPRLIGYTAAKAALVSVSK